MVVRTPSAEQGSDAGRAEVAAHVQRIATGRPTRSCSLSQYIRPRFATTARALKSTVSLCGTTLALKFLSCPRSKNEVQSVQSE